MKISDYKKYFDTNPKVLLNLVSAYMSLKRFPDKVWHQPISLQLEASNNCNFRCLMCPRTYLGKNFSHCKTKSKNVMDVGSLSLENYYKVIEQFPYVKNLALHGMGEPLLNDQLDRMIGDAKERGIKYVWIITNGSLLTETWSRRLLDAGLDALGISFEGINKNYEKTRVGGEFNKVVNNIKRFLELRDEMKAHTIVSVNITFFRDNKDCYKDMLLMFRDIGVDFLAGGNVDSSFTQHGKEKLRGMDVGWFREITNFAKANNIPFEYDFSEPGCSIPWIKPYITWDGFVTPCCFRPFANHFNFGNVLQQKFSDIWNGPAYRKFRNDFKNGRPPLICRKCYIYKSCK